MGIESKVSGKSGDDCLAGCEVLEEKSKRGGKSGDDCVAGCEHDIEEKQRARNHVARYMFCARPGLHKHKARHVVLGCSEQGVKPVHVPPCGADERLASARLRAMRAGADEHVLVRRDDGRCDDPCRPPTEFGISIQQSSGCQCF